jgi:hypothetical protein
VWRKKLADDTSYVGGRRRPQSDAAGDLHPIRHALQTCTAIIADNHAGSSNVKSTRESDCTVALTGSHSRP